MLNDFTFYHGAVLSEIVHGTRGSISIQIYPTQANSSYVVNGVGLYIKHSSKRLSPWRFTFQREHQNEIREMVRELGEVYTALVCGKDGVATLSYAQLKAVLDDEHQTAEWVSVARGPRQQYNVEGSNGKLKFKVPRKALTDKFIVMDGSENLDLEA